MPKVRDLLERLTEVLETPSHYEWSEKNPTHYEARFEIGGVPYLCEFGIYGRGGKWNAAFYIDKELSPEVKAKFARKDASGITGTGNASAVLSTVVAITREFVKLAEPTQITFSAREASRVRLYDTMVRRLTQGTGWTYEKRGIGLFTLSAPAAKTATESDDDDQDVAGRRETARGKSLAELGGHPEKVTIYRAVPGTKTRMFKPMDYVTLSFKFARGHAQHNADMEEEPSLVLSALVPAKDVYEAPNTGEYFYDGPEVAARVAFTAKPSWSSGT